MMGAMTDQRALLSLLEAATDRLLRTVHALPDEAFAEPSALPAWRRAHVVAHLALNGEALAAALAGVAVGQEVAMYPSQEARDAGIAELAATSPALLRSRLRTAVRGFSGALSLVPPDAMETVIHRLPGSARTFRPADAVGMRLRETEIHHADLAASYAHTDWDRTFAEHLVATVTARETAPFVVRATDTSQEWTTAAGTGPVVSGTVADLGWWLTGRGGEDRLEVSGGPMPTIGKW